MLRIIVLRRRPCLSPGTIDGAAPDVGGMASLLGEGPYARIEMESAAAPFALLAGVAELADARDSKSRDLHWS